jgi:hypothetical protein
LWLCLRALPPSCDAAPLLRGGAAAVTPVNTDAWIWLVLILPMRCTPLLCSPCPFQGEPPSEPPSDKEGTEEPTPWCSSWLWSAWLCWSFP